MLVSRCLTGAACRYDGASRPAHALSLLPDDWTLLDLCPEADLGMGTPRPPIGLLAAKGRLLLKERNGARDWTWEMGSWCGLMARVLVRDGAAGAVLKAHSPSCGHGDVEVFASSATMAWPSAPEAALRQDADGLWTRALLDLDPLFPLISEESLEDECRRLAFISAVESRSACRVAP